jgi:tetratricopeptide (TPR) repeat protein
MGGSESTSDSALLLAVRGTTYYQQGDLNQSLDLLNKSISLDPYSVRAWMTRGDVLSAMGRYNEAVDAYSQVLHLDPSDGPAAAKKGDALVNAGKYQEAITSYDRAIAAAPSLPGVQVNRSMAKQLAGGMIRTNVSIVETDDTEMLNVSRDSPVITLPGTTPAATIPPVSPVPGTTKASVPPSLAVVSIIFAGFLLIGIRKR